MSWQTHTVSRRYALHRAGREGHDGAPMALDVDRRRALHLDGAEVLVHGAVVHALEQRGLHRARAVGALDGQLRRWHAHFAEAAIGGEADDGVEQQVVPAVEDLLHAGFGDPGGAGY